MNITESTSRSLSFGPYHTFARTQGISFAIIIAGSMTLPPAYTTRIWIYMVVSSTSLTVLVYAAFDRTKFEGYLNSESHPLSSWSRGTYGLVDFFEIKKFPGLYSFYILRTCLSIIINVSSVLIVLIDSMCLKVRLGGESAMPPWCISPRQESTTCKLCFWCESSGFAHSKYLVHMFRLLVVLFGFYLVGGVPQQCVSPKLRT